MSGGCRSVDKLLPVYRVVCRTTISPDHIFDHSATRNTCSHRKQRSKRHTFPDGKAPENTEQTPKMTGEMEAVWDQRLGGLRKFPPEDKVETWFDGAALLEMESGDVFLMLPTDSKREIIQKRYLAAGEPLEVRRRGRIKSGCTRWAAHGRSGAPASDHVTPSARTRYSPRAPRAGAGCRRRYRGRVLPRLPRRNIHHPT